jgi:hypothetical protein
MEQRRRSSVHTSWMQVILIVLPDPTSEQGQHVATPVKASGMKHEESLTAALKAHPPVWVGMVEYQVLVTCGQQYVLCPRIKPQKSAVRPEENLECESSSRDG